MRLHSELYRNILVLHVSQFITPKSIEIFNDNFKKLERLKTEYVFVDLTHAMISDDALTSARSTKILRTYPGLKGVYYIGEHSGLCEYRTLEQALRACPALEAQMVRDKMQLEIEISKLKVKQFDLEKEQTDATAVRTLVHRLALENRQLKRIRQSMIQEIDQVEKSKKVLEGKKPNSDLLKEIEDVKSEILKMVADMGVK